MTTTLIALTLYLFSCNSDDNNTPVNPGYTLTFKSKSTNDTLTVEFEVSGITTSQPLTYENLSFSSEYFAVAMRIINYTNGNLTYKVYKDTLQVFSKTYNSVIDTVNYGVGKPTKVEIIPFNFEGKGNVQLKRSF